MGSQHVGLQGQFGAELYLADRTAQTAAAATYAVAAGSRNWFILLLLLVILHLGLVGNLQATVAVVVDNSRILCRSTAAFSLAAVVLAATATTATANGWWHLLRAATIAVLLIVGSLVAVHVAIGGEGLAADLAREGSLPGVDEHVAVQGAEGGEHLAAQAAVVHLRLACTTGKVKCGKERSPKRGSVSVSSKMRTLLGFPKSPW
jgi:hypothetical protein